MTNKIVRKYVNSTPLVSYMSRTRCWPRVGEHSTCGVSLPMLLLLKQELMILPWLIYIGSNLWGSMYHQRNFNHHIEKREREKEGEEKHIFKYIGFSINPPCNFLFEPKSCIIVLNLSALREKRRNIWSEKRDIHNIEYNICLQGRNILAPILWL